VSQPVAELLARYDRGVVGDAECLDALDGMCLAEQERIEHATASVAELWNELARQTARNAATMAKMDETEREYARMIGPITEGNPELAAELTHDLAEAKECSAEFASKTAEEIAAIRAEIVRRGEALADVRARVAATRRKVKRLRARVAIRASGRDARPRRDRPRSRRRRSTRTRSRSPSSLSDDDSDADPLDDRETGA
jgi:chromosome segregation ATPase